MLPAHGDDEGELGRKALLNPALHLVIVDDFDVGRSRAVENIPVVEVG